MRYLITFSCYGARLHGDERGSVDRSHNRPGSRLLPEQAERAAAERKRMNQPPYSLDQDGRAAVLEALRRVCVHRGWTLFAAHVRTNHVHAIMEADARPEKVLNDFKSYSSRCLNDLGFGEPDRKKWARHGSTRWLWKEDDVAEAVRYVLERQGDAMAIFEK